MNHLFSSLCLAGALLLGICTDASATFRIQTFPASSRPADPAPAAQVIDRALTTLGTPYRWGGTNPRQGFDCSGLVHYVFKPLDDLELPRTSRALSRLDAPSVKRADLEPGDLLFFRIHSRSVDHVAIYLGGDRFIHAPRRGAHVRIDHLDNHYWQRHFQSAKRVVPAV